MSPEEIKKIVELGKPLPSISDEKFCLLIVRGSDPKSAMAIAYQDNTNQNVKYAKTILKRPHIAARIQALRDEISMRTTISLAHKRDILAKMTLGEIPTETIKLPGGKVIEKFQPLSALKYDAKLSGEESAKKIDVMGTGIKLSFELPNRDGSPSIPIEATPVSTPSLLDAIDDEDLDDDEDIEDEDDEYNEESFSLPTPTEEEFTQESTAQVEDKFDDHYTAKLIENVALSQHEQDEHIQ
jgi:hypothetical protein